MSGIDLKSFQILGDSEMSWNDTFNYVLFKNPVSATVIDSVRCVVSFVFILLVHYSHSKIQRQLISNPLSVYMPGAKFETRIARPFLLDNPAIILS